MCWRAVTNADRQLRRMVVMMTRMRAHTGTVTRDRMMAVSSLMDSCQILQREARRDGQTLTGVNVTLVVRATARVTRDATRVVAKRKSIKPLSFRNSSCHIITPIFFCISHPASLKNTVRTITACYNSGFHIEIHARENEKKRTISISIGPWWPVCFVQVALVAIDEILYKKKSKKKERGKDQDCCITAVCICPPSAVSAPDRCCSGCQSRPWRKPLWRQSLVSGPPRGQLESRLERIPEFRFAHKPP